MMIETEFPELLIDSAKAPVGVGIKKWFGPLSDVYE